MADFCKQCTADVLGIDGPSDLAGLTTEADEAAGLFAVVLCEGCGPIQVDRHGACVSTNCAEDGHKPDGGLLAKGLAL